MCSFGRISSLDMATAVQHLSDPDPELQVLGAAFIQHECYNDSDSKVAVGTPRLNCWLETPTTTVKTRTETVHEIVSFLTLFWVNLPVGVFIPVYLFMIDYISCNIFIFYIIIIFLGK